jgi:hypothetical protein
VIAQQADIGRSMSTLFESCGSTARVSLVFALLVECKRGNRRCFLPPGVERIPEDFPRLSAAEVSNWRSYRAAFDASPAAFFAAESYRSSPSPRLVTFARFERKGPKAANQNLAAEGRSCQEKSRSIRVVPLASAMEQMRGIFQTTSRL